jgi:lauroyl/myristoyl acyltransferase
MSTVKEVIRLLNDGGMASLLCDRDIQHTGIIVPFCGKETCMPVGPAQLAMRTKALVVPMFSRRTHLNNFEIYSEPLGGSYRRRARRAGESHEFWQYGKVPTWTGSGW